MKEMKVTLTKEQYQGIYGRTKSDKVKGDVIEEISKQILLQLGVEEVFNNTDLEDQVNKGDLLVIRKDKENFIVESKSSHTFYITDTDKLAFDYKYYKKNTNCKIPYHQSTTDTYLGWIYYSKADVVMAFNTDSKKMYVIRQYQKLKYKVLNAIEQYIENLPKGCQTWYQQGHNNYINKYLEGGVNKSDYGKDSLICNLELSKEAIEFFDGKLTVYNVTIEQDTINLDNKKILTSLPTESISSKRI